MGGGEGVWRWGEREIIYLSLHCHHQSDSCIKMGSAESHFNVSLIVRDKVTTVHEPQLLKRKEGRVPHPRAPTRHIAQIKINVLLNVHRNHEAY